MTDLPTYPMDHPDRQQVAVLDHLVDGVGATKRDLIDFGREAGLALIADHEAANRKSEHRLLDSHVLGPLREAGYVTVDGRGRSGRVAATEAGENPLRAFRYLIE